MRLEKAKNFITPAQCAELNVWVRQGVSFGWLDTGISSDGPTNKRVTSRMYGPRYRYPQFVRDISDRVRSYCGVADYPHIVKHGRDGVVVSCTFPGGDVYAHRDPLSADGLATLRCNIMTQAADEGAVLHIDGIPVPVEVGELHCYLVSEHTHHVTQASGETNRIMWMFGAHVPVDDWNSGKIKVGN